MDVSVNLVDTFSAYLTDGASKVRKAILCFCQYCCARVFPSSEARRKNHF